MRQTLRKKQRRLRKTRRNKRGGGNNNSFNWNEELKKQEEFNKMIGLNNNEFNFEKVALKVNKSFLYPGNYAIVPKNKSLSTAGLATCSVLAMTIGTKKFLAHLSAKTDTYMIIKNIKKTIEEEKAEPKDVIIYAGGGYGTSNSRITIDKAKEICKAVKIPDDEIEIRYVCFMDTIYT